MSFDRKAHCRRVGSLGGRATVAKYGSSHMSAIGVRGFRAFSARFSSVRAAKRWLSETGSYVYWQQTRLPDTGKFLARLPVAPWDNEAPF